MIKKIQVKPVLQSTNNYVANKFKQGLLDEGTVIMALCQSNGRGQRGAEWQSATGKNLTFSFYVCPHGLLPVNQFLLAEAISLAVFDFLKSQVDGSLYIKWPNDVLLNEKKVCGILIENTISSTKIVKSIIGIGLNVNQTQFDDLPKAGSLKLHTGKDFDLLGILNKLIPHLNFRLQQILNREYHNIEVDYLQALLGYRKELVYSQRGNVFTGVIEGVKRSGQLVIREKGSSHSAEYTLKEIELIY